MSEENCLLFHEARVIVENIFLQILEILEFNVFRDCNRLLVLPTMNSTRDKCSSVACDHRHL